jgi:hypothetical protein
MKIQQILAAAAFVVITTAPALFAQNPNAPGQAVAAEHRAEVSLPERFDTSRVALRDLPDRPVSTPPRGGRDFEPGRPDAVGNANTPFVDPLAARGSGPSQALAVPMAAGSFGTPIDPAARVAPPDTTGDLSPTHYVQWVNLRYSVYTLTRDASGNITNFNLV